MPNNNWAARFSKQSDLIYTAHIVDTGNSTAKEKSTRKLTLSRACWLRGLDADKRLRFVARRAELLHVRCCPTHLAEVSVRAVYRTAACALLPDTFGRGPIITTRAKKRCPPHSCVGSRFSWRRIRKPLFYFQRSTQVDPSCCIKRRERSAQSTERCLLQRRLRLELPTILSESFYKYQNNESGWKTKRTQMRCA